MINSNTCGLMSKDLLGQGREEEISHPAERLSTKEEYLCPAERRVLDNTPRADGFWAAPNMNLFRSPPFWIWVGAASDTGIPPQRRCLHRTLALITFPRRFRKGSEPSLVMASQQHRGGGHRIRYPPTIQVLSNAYPNQPPS